MAQIPTARGNTVDSKDIGFALMTECLIGPSDAELQNNWPEYTVAYTPDSDLIEKLHTAKAHGVDTILDRVISSAGRNPVRLKRIAEQSPVNLIIGTGWHTVTTCERFPEFFAWAQKDFAWAEPDIRPENDSEATRYYRERVKEAVKNRHWPSFEEVMLKDIREGMAGTGIRAAFIKLATDGRGLTPGVTEVIRTCAKVHRETGVFITTHTGIGIGALAGALQQRLLKECGVDLSRVILGHMDFTPPHIPIDEFVKLADKGSLLCFDTLRLSFQWPEKWRETRIQRVVELCKRGYAEHVMISHDDALWHDVQPEPVHLFPTFCEVKLDLIPKLKERGVTDKQIEQMTIGNPRRIFESNGLGPY